MRYICLVICIVLIKDISANEIGITPEWDIKKNRIINKSVCKNYKYGSINYRKCRSKAARIFKERCKKSKSKIYCRAHYSFKPIN